MLPARGGPMLASARHSRCASAPTPRRTFARPRKRRWKARGVDLAAMSPTPITGARLPEGKRLVALRRATGHLLRGGLRAPLTGPQRERLQESRRPTP